MSHNVEIEPKATWKEWFGLGVLILVVFMLATDVSMIIFSKADH